jgi:glyoxylase-like metal-dependent hydrolase (beta-lactamase superfamily II)
MSIIFEGQGLTIQRIVEREEGFMPALDVLPSLTPERLDENRIWLEPRALDPATGRLVLCFQSYVVRTPFHTVLVDTCVGNHKHRPKRPSWHMQTGDTYMRGLATLGLSVEDIDIVVCTHLHADHIGWNTRLEDGRWVPTFPNARYVFSEAELMHWTSQADPDRSIALADSVLPVVAAGRADLVADDYAIDDFMRLMPTPGHTPNHVAVLAGRQETVAAFTGDLIHSPLQARYPDLSMFSDSDPTLAASVRRGFLERFCDTPTLCCTAHFPSPSVGRVARWGNGFSCEPVPG